MSGRAADTVESRMKTVTRSLILSCSPISSDQLVELLLYCRRIEVVVASYSKCVV